MKKTLLATYLLALTLGQTAQAADKEIIFQGALSDDDLTAWSNKYDTNIFVPVLACTIQKPAKDEVKKVYIAVNGLVQSTENLENLKADEVRLLNNSAYLVFEKADGTLEASNAALNVHLVANGYEKMDSNNRSLNASVTHFGEVNKTILSYVPFSPTKIKFKDKKMNCTTDDKLFSKTNVIKL